MLSCFMSVCLSVSLVLNLYSLCTLHPHGVKIVTTLSLIIIRAPVVQLLCTCITWFQLMHVLKINFLLERVMKVLGRMVWLCGKVK